DALRACRRAGARRKYRLPVFRDCFLGALKYRLVALGYVSQVPFGDISSAARPSYLPDFDISGKTCEISADGSSAESAAGTRGSRGARKEGVVAVEAAWATIPKIERMFAISILWKGAAGGKG